MDLEEWEVLPEDGFLQIHDDGAGKKIFSRKYGAAPTSHVFKMNYFVCPPPANPANQFVETTTQLVPLPLPSVQFIGDHHQMDMAATEAEPDRVSQVFFKKIKETEFPSDMKLDSPKSTVEDDDGESSDHENGGLNLLNWSTTGVGAILSFGVAAVVSTVCILIAGNRQKHRKNQKLRVQIYTDDKRIKQMVHHATRLNEAISGVPITRAHITIGDIDKSKADGNMSPLGQTIEFDVAGLRKYLLIAERNGNESFLTLKPIRECFEQKLTRSTPRRGLNRRLRVASPSGSITTEAKLLSYEQSREYRYRQTQQMYKSQKGYPRLLGGQLMAKNKGMARRQENRRGRETKFFYRWGAERAPTVRVRGPLTSSSGRTRLRRISSRFFAVSPKTPSFLLAPHNRSQRTGNSADGRVEIGAQEDCVAGPAEKRACYPTRGSARKWKVAADAAGEISRKSRRRRRHREGVVCRKLYITLSSKERRGFSCHESVASSKTRRG
nr:Titin like [Ipomoea batatas]